MITLKKSNNIFYSRRIVLDFLSNDLSESDQALDNVDWFELRISGTNNENVFDEFLSKFIGELKSNFVVSFISYEAAEALKNRMRSYAKHYYSLRKAHLVNDEYLAEKEIDTGENKSFFAGIMRIDEVDDDIIRAELLGNYSKVVHAKSKESPFATPDYLSGLLSKIDLDLLNKNKLIDVNYLKLLSEFVKEDSLVFTYLYDGKDDLVFSVYAGNKISREIESSLLESLPSTDRVRIVEASSKDVDRLIESYFND